MEKKTITKKVTVTVNVPYTKTFEVTKDLDWDEDWMKAEGWDEDEYIEMEFEDDFVSDAEKMMDKHIEETSIDIMDLNWDDRDTESEIIYDL